MVGFDTAKGLLLALVLFVAGVPAASAEELPRCSEVTDEAASGEALYLRIGEAALEVWQETNGLEGLQTEACEDGDGDEHGADERVQTVSLDPDVPQVPDVIGLCNQIVMIVSPTLRCE